MLIWGLIHCHRKSAPDESREMALDVITQFCNNVNVHLCLKVLLTVIDTIFQEHTNGKEMFAALNIFDRLVVKIEKTWLNENIERITTLLIQVECLSL